MAGLHTISSTVTHTHTIIFLHGRDSIGSEFAAELFESQASDGKTLPEIFPSFKWVFPASAPRHSARFGIDLSQWFDIWSVEEPEERKETQTPGLPESVAAIREVVEREAASVPLDRLILGGISQGCATAIHALLQGGCRVGAFVGFCGWLPLQAEVEGVARSSAEPSERQRLLHSLIPSLHQVPLGEDAGTAMDTLVFLAHCKDDDMVPVGNGERLCKTLRELGMTVEWHAYEDGGHWVNEPKGVDDMAAFLRKVQ